MGPGEEEVTKTHKETEGGREEGGKKERRKGERNIINIFIKKNKPAGNTEPERRESGK